jgi:hypothetical protein
MKFGQLFLSVFVFGMSIHMSHVDAKLQPLRARRCIRNDKQLRMAVEKASRKNYTQINICAETIPFQNALDVSRKWIDIRCVNVSMGCTFDAKHQAGFMFGTKSHIKINGINFVGGKSVHIGGFIGRERAPINLFDSTVLIKGSSFSGCNTRFSGVFEARYGEVSLDQVEFRGNAGNYMPVSEINCSTKPNYIFLSHF